MRRLFIESDILQEDELHSAQRTVSAILKRRNEPHTANVFDEIKSSAWHELEQAWELVKECDEIYADSALVPLCGFSSYTGAPVIMDVMMQKTIEEKIKGKSVYFLRSIDDIYWDQIDIKLLKKAFKHNRLYTWRETSQPYGDFVQVDINKLYKKLKSDGY